MVREKKEEERKQRKRMKCREDIEVKVGTSREGKEGFGKGRKCKERKQGKKFGKGELTKEKCRERKQRKRLECREEVRVGKQGRGKKN